MASASSTELSAADIAAKIRGLEATLAAQRAAMRETETELKAWRKVQQKCADAAAVAEAGLPSKRAKLEPPPTPPRSPSSSSDDGEASSSDEDDATAGVAAAAPPPPPPAPPSPPAVVAAPPVLPVVAAPAEPPPSARYSPADAPRAMARALRENDAEAVVAILYGDTPRTLEARWEAARARAACAWASACS